ncbi:MAG: carbamate kinase [bacterium]
MSKLVLIAVGGNALIRANEHGTAELQFQNALDTATTVVRLIQSGDRVVLTHGNGPQVGAALLRSERAACDAYRMPLDVCVAATQGEIGYYLQYALWQMMQKMGIQVPVVSLITQVRVDKNDPAFLHPSKGIGPFYSAEMADRYRRELKWEMAEYSHGFRRIVSSPEPKEIIELAAIRACVNRGLVVIAGGGGGIPVFNDHVTEKGVEAVIDKDLTSSLLATELNADVFAIATEVDHVFVDFGRPGQRRLDNLTAEECRHLYHAGQFPAGTMGPKMKAAMLYLDRGGKEAIITDIEHLYDAIQGNEGTHIVAENENVVATPA